MELFDWLKQYSLDSKNIWILYIFLIVFITLIANFIELKCYHRLMRRLEMTQSVWDDAIIWAIHKPLGILIWLYGISYAADVANVTFVDWLDVARRVGLVMLIAWIFVRFANKVQENLNKQNASLALLESKLDKGTLYSLTQLFKIAILITA